MCANYRIYMYVNQWVTSKQYINKVDRDRDKEREIYI